jgi:hypothetical protein
MNAADPRHLLDRHAGRVFTRWRERLRALPPSSALAQPELLIPLMSSAFARVRHTAALAFLADDTVASDAPTLCRCGLNPLVAFYLTGECATFDVLWGQSLALRHLLPDERERLCRAISHAWRLVGADEMAVFCGLCQQGNSRSSSAAHAASRSSDACATTPTLARHATRLVTASGPSVG